MLIWLLHGHINAHVPGALDNIIKGLSTALGEILLEGHAVRRLQGTCRGWLCYDATGLSMYHAKVHGIAYTVAYGDHKAQKCTTFVVQLC